MKSNNLLKNAIGIIAICIPASFSSCTSGTAGTDHLPASISQMMQSDAHVSIGHMTYDPDTLTVVKGTRVTWTDSQSIIPHTVTSDSKGLFDSGNMHKKDTFSYVFNVPGTFTYYCRHHGKMHGTVIVH